MKSELIEKYDVKTFSTTRRIVSDFYDEGMKIHHVKGLFEADVALAKEKISEHSKNNDKPVSFTAWVIKCIGKTVSDHPEIHAMRKGQNKLIIFDSIDIATMIEKQTANNKKIPLTYVVRDVSNKTVFEISKEIRNAQKKQSAEEDQLITRKKLSIAMELFLLIPKFIRSTIYKKVSYGNPFSFKQKSGTVMVTSIGMFGQNKTGWAIPFGFHTVNVAIGTIARKPVVKNDEIVISEVLHLTTLINHDIVDGAPAARFAADLIDLLESAYGL